MKMDRKITILDINQSSFLAMNGLEPELVMQSGRVLFSFPLSEDFYRLSTEYNQNKSVNVLDFVTSLRTLRSRMMREKENANEGYHGKSFNR
jgi:hypothetical protein